MSGGFTLADPYWLLALPVALLIAWLAERHATVRLGPRRLPVRIARGLLLVLLVLALADPNAWRREDRLTVIFAVDASRSIGSSAREFASRYLEEAASALPEGDRAGVVVVGEETMVESHPAEAWQPGELLAVPGGDATDLESTVRMARGLFPAGNETRLVLLTDGLETRGSLENAVAGAGEDLDLVWVPLETRPGGEVLVDSVIAPDRVTEGQPHRVRVLVQASVETEAMLRVYRGGSLISAAPVRLQPGKGNLFSLELDAPDSAGSLLYRAEIDAAEDGVVENNRAATVVRVEGRPRILVIDSDPGALRPLTRSLEGAEMSVTRAGPSGLPSTLGAMAAFDAILLSDAPATDFSDAQLEALEGYVSVVGGGLVMLGGPDSLGPGGYWKTPVERALPVDMDVKDRRHYPSVGLVLCIDKSGSMAGEAGVQKIDVAKTAAAEVARHLTPMDRFGLVAFDAAAKWVVPMAPGGDADPAISRLGTLRAGGGTDAYPAMQEAFKALDEVDVRVKHVILLTDGQLAGRDHEGLALRMASRGISVSTVAIGSDADLHTLNRIARVGAGEFYRARDVRRLPRIFLREAFRVSRAWLKEEPFQPAVGPYHPVLSGWNDGNAPPLEGYVVTTPKPAAQHPLQALEGDPLLSAWRYGLGNSVTFTSDAKGRWGKNWVRWDGYEPFWIGVVRWAARDQEGHGRVHATARVSGEGIRLSADLYAADGSFINGARPRAVVAGPGGERVEIPARQVGPGRYEAVLPAADEGLYVAAMIDDVSKTGATVTAVVPYSSEFRTLDRTPDGLERLVASGRARVETSPEEVFRHTGRGGLVRTSLAPLFLAFACSLLVGEVAARKLNLRPGKRRRKAGVRKSSTPSLVRLRSAKDRLRERMASEPVAGEKKTEEMEVSPTPAPPVRKAPAGVSVPEPPEPDNDSTLTSRLLKKKRDRRR